MLHENQDKNKNKKTVRVSTLAKTWILDLDGTVVKHNGYKIDGQDCFLDGAKEFLDAIPAQDMIIFLTSRTRAYQEMTEAFLRGAGVRYDEILYDAPFGERILINDCKPSGLPTAVAVNTKRDVFMEVSFVPDGQL